MKCTVFRRPALRVDWHRSDMNRSLLHDLIDAQSVLWYDTSVNKVLSKYGWTCVSRETDPDKYVFRYCRGSETISVIIFRTVRDHKLSEISSCDLIPKTLLRHVR